MTLWGPGTGAPSWRGPGVRAIRLRMLAPTGWVPADVCIPAQLVATQVTLGVIKQLADMRIRSPVPVLRDRGIICHWCVSAFVGTMVLTHTVTAASERFRSAGKDLVVAVKVNLRPVQSLQDRCLVAVAGVIRHPALP